MELNEMEAAIEGILFAAGEPVDLSRLCLALDLDREHVEAACIRLSDSYRYERRGMRLVQMGCAYQLCSAPEHASAIRTALGARRPAKLSQSALEVLALVAYFQPITRAYIDQIRGVDSAYTVGLLADRGLIEESGRLAVPGRPIQYRTTQSFLRTFGLNDLGDLPQLPGVPSGEQEAGLELEHRLAQLRALQEQEREAVEP